METKTKICTVCGVKIAGFGQTNLDKNVAAHMEQQHFEEVLAEEPVEEVEEVLEKAPLEDYTKKELLRAFDGDDVTSRMTKAQIIEAIEAREE